MTSPLQEMLKQRLATRSESHLLVPRNNTVIAWTEVYTALQTGVADGQMNPVPIISFTKINEVQKYLALSGHLFAPYVWVVNKAVVWRPTGRTGTTVL
jgi:hypothetical protein